VCGWWWWPGKRSGCAASVNSPRRANADDNRRNVHYQYFWWVNTPQGDTDHFSARGKYGQYIYVAPEKDLVIIRLGKEEGERGYGYWIELFQELATKLDISAKEAR
jgi:CubicO group peptidase (beta-lactamase class C family)